ncbi:MAG: hypothetical protein WD184_01625 [Acidimicrobiia bacterium]
MFSALAVWTPEDGLLGALAPLGLALAADDAVVVDLDPLGPQYPGDRSLADLVRDGVRKDDLTPRRGIGVLRNGGVAPLQARPVVEALLAHLPRLVLRLPPRPVPAGLPMPVVPVRLLLPGSLFAPQEGPAVFQATPSFARLPGVGVRLPVPQPATVRLLLEGRRPPAKDRWVRAWRSAWSLPWQQ